MDKDNIEIPSDRLLRGLLLLKNFEWGNWCVKEKVKTWQDSLIWNTAP